jgi:hypothetical protein
MYSAQRAKKGCFMQYVQKQKIVQAIQMPQAGTMIFTFPDDRGEAGQREDRVSFNAKDFMVVFPNNKIEFYAPDRFRSEFEPPKPSEAKPADAQSAPGSTGATPINSSVKKSNRGRPPKVAQPITQQAQQHQAAA